MIRNVAIDIPLMCCRHEIKSVTELVLQLDDIFEKCRELGCVLLYDNNIWSGVEYASNVGDVVSSLLLKHLGLLQTIN